MRRVEYAEVLGRIIDGRRSIRRFGDAPVLEEDLMRLIRAAGHAPSADNLQYWHFIVIRNRAVLEQMEQAIRETIEEMLTWEQIRANGNLEAMVRAIHRHSTFFVSAPVVVAVLTKPYNDPLQTWILPERGIRGENIRHLWDADVQSIGAAIQNLLLMAHCLGYGACWMTGPLVAAVALEKILGVRPPWKLAAVIPIGMPAEVPRPRPRKPVSEICSFI